MSLNDVNFNRVMETAKRSLMLETQLRNKRTELCLTTTVKTPDVQLMEKLRRECHDLLDLILDNETTMIANVVKDEMDNLNKE